MESDVIILQNKPVISDYDPNLVFRWADPIKIRAVYWSSLLFQCPCFLFWSITYVSFLLLSNHSLPTQERVGSLKGGVEFLELCEFERMEGGEFLFLPRDKVDMAVLNSAGSELDSAIKNPFFGVL